MPSSACKTSALDRKSTRLNSSHTIISYAVFCLKTKRASRGPAACLATPRRCPRHRGGRPPAAARGRDRVVGGATAGAEPRHRCPFFFFNDTATTEIYAVSLHGALPI